MNVNGWTLNGSRKAAKPGLTDDNGVTTKIESCSGNVLPLTLRVERPVEAGTLILKS